MDKHMCSYFCADSYMFQFDLFGNTNSEMGNL